MDFTLNLNDDDNNTDNIKKNKTDDRLEDSAEELGCDDIVPRVFYDWDSDESGDLDLEEVMEGIRWLCHATPLHFEDCMIPSLFEQVDVNNNHVLDKDEFEVFLRRFALQWSIEINDLGYVISKVPLQQLQLRSQPQSQGEEQPQRKTKRGVGTFLSNLNLLFFGIQKRSSVPLLQAEVRTLSHPNSGGSLPYNNDLIRQRSYRSFQLCDDALAFSDDGDSVAASITEHENASSPSVAQQQQQQRQHNQSTMRFWQRLKMALTLANTAKSTVKDDDFDDDSSQSYVESGDGCSVSDTYHKTTSDELLLGLEKIKKSRQMKSISVNETKPTRILAER